MVLIETTRYKRTLKKEIINKHKDKELIRLENIKNLFIGLNNMQEVFDSPYKNIYHIEKKKGDLKEYFTARINSKIRLIVKPLNSYPYSLLEIECLELTEIDSSHYGEG